MLNYKPVIFPILIASLLLFAACGTSPPEPAPTETALVGPTATPGDKRIEIVWYIGLGTGTQAKQIPMEEAWVEAFNASQNRIKLSIHPAGLWTMRYSRDELSMQIERGNAPDIVGPMGTEGWGYFKGEWLDLGPLIEQTGYDTSWFDPAFLDFYTEDDELVGLPFAIFPSALYYNKALFDAAGLPYPPHKVGEKYVLDGEERVWDFDTVALIARRLTLYAEGRDATQPGFDREHIVQYGFDFQWVKDNPRWFSAYFEPFYPVAKDGTAEFSPGQIDAFRWFYDAMWGAQPFLPTQAAMDTDHFGKSNSFKSGHVAMALTHLWYTCCFDNSTVPNWDVAVVPSYKGKTTAKMHGDTFGIMKYTKHPKEAFEVLTYMLGEGSKELLEI